MGSSEPSRSVFDIKDGYALSLKWFEIHADQRMKLIQYYLTAVGVCIAGYAVALQNKVSLVATAFCALVIVFGVIFKVFDRRTCQLIKVAESALSKACSAMVAQTGVPEFDIILRSNESGNVPTYRKTLNVLFWVLTLVGILGLIPAWSIHP